jgi:hypothetical protein
MALEWRQTKNPKTPAAASRLTRAGRAVEASNPVAAGVVGKAAKPVAEIKVATRAERFLVRVAAVAERCRFYSSNPFRIIAGWKGNPQDRALEALLGEDSALPLADPRLAGFAANAACLSSCSAKPLQ